MYSFILHDSSIASFPFSLGTSRDALVSPFCLDAFHDTVAFPFSLDAFSYPFLARALPLFMVNGFPSKLSESCANMVRLNLLFTPFLSPDSSPPPNTVTPTSHWTTRSRSI